MNLINKLFSNYNSQVNCDNMPDLGTNLSTTFSCPICNSTNIAQKFIISTKDLKMIDSFHLCKNCDHKDTFVGFRNANISKERNKRIDRILDGIS